MLVYDCDDDDQFKRLAERVDRERLGDHNLLSTYGPDSLAEARNRGFRPVSGSEDSAEEG